MDAERIPHRLTGTRFVRALRNFATSTVGIQARWMFAALILFLFAINGMNVVNSYVGRDFMTAIADRDRAEFARQAVFYLAVFAISTLISVSSRFTEERLALLWRNYLTKRAVDIYLGDGTYYRLEASHSLANPDQRITEDIRAFTVTTLSFVLMLLNSSFTVVAFAGVLWAISPTLFIVAVLYAAGGSLMTILLGRKLIKLNYDQLDREANFRAGLIHVRENAEAIRAAGGEACLQARLTDRLGAVIRNFRRIICVNRNLGFFTTGYNWLIQIIPALIIAPAFFDGRVEFGVVTQSAMAFSTLVAAFSLIVTQFQSISSFAAVVERLSSLVHAIEQPQNGGTATPIALREAPDTLAFEDLTLASPEDGRPLIQSLSVAIAPGTRVLVRSRNEAATLALFRATAGLAVTGTGRLARPAAQELMMLAERPYLPPGTLRSVLVPAGMDPAIADDRVRALLADWQIEPIVARAGGLDAEQDWDTLLSLGELQLLACLRVLLARPRFVVLDRPGTTLGRERAHRLLAQLADASIGTMHLGDADEPSDLYDAVLDIAEDGNWTWTQAQPNPAAPGGGIHD